MTVVELTEPPAGLSRAALASLAYRRRPPGLPDTTLVLRGVRSEVRRLAAYSRVCGYRLRTALPPRLAARARLPDGDEAHVR